MGGSSPGAARPRGFRWPPLAALAAALAIVAAPVEAGGGRARQIAQTTTAQPKSAAPVAFDAEASTTANGARLAIRLSRRVAASAFALERPDRIIVDLPEVNFQLGEEAGQKAVGLIKSYRYGLFGAGRSRIVIDLAQPAIADVEVEGGADDGFARLLIKLSRAERQDFARQAREPQRTASAAPPAPTVAPADSRPMLVIDPGHGGVDPGARAKNGLQEKAVVFEVAKALKEKLIASGRYRVAMTREDDVFVALQDRVKFARQLQADLLISLHADALAATDAVRGASIYTGSDRASDAYAARLAESENRADSAAGADDASEMIDDINDILSDLTRRETRAFAHRFARTLVGGLGSAMPMHKAPLKSAGFRVLMAPDVPSVLIELGYLTNMNDIAFLTSPDGRAKATTAIASAIDKYFAGRSRP